jgi:hypothetical protein
VFDDAVCTQHPHSLCCKLCPKLNCHNIETRFLIAPIKKPCTYIVRKLEPAQKRIATYPSSCFNFKKKQIHMLDPNQILTNCESKKQFIKIKNSKVNLGNVHEIF